MSKQGTPVWYELTTTDPAAAEGFYSDVLGWQVADSGMPGFDYRVARAGDAMVAGMMLPQAPGIPPNWGIYFAVDDCDATAKAATDAGATIYAGPMDIAGVGRFATMADPQGAVFSILQDSDDSVAFEPMKAGHGNWHELMTPDPVAGLAFYSALLGWQAGMAMDMGPMGTYQIFTAKGVDIGGMMGLGNAPVPAWLPSFGVAGVDAAVARIKAAGGQMVYGPAEVPGGRWAGIATDPQGAFFGLVGPK